MMFRQCPSIVLIVAGILLLQPFTHVRCFALQKSVAAELPVDLIERLQNDEEGRIHCEYQLNESKHSISADILPLVYANENQARRAFDSIAKSLKWQVELQIKPQIEEMERSTQMAPRCRDMAREQGEAGWEGGSGVYGNYYSHISDRTEKVEIGNYDQVQAIRRTLSFDCRSYFVRTSIRPQPPRLSGISSTTKTYYALVVREGNLVCMVKNLRMEYGYVQNERDEKTYHGIPSQDETSFIDQLIKNLQLLLHASEQVEAFRPIMDNAIVDILQLGKPLTQLELQEALDLIDLLDENELNFFIDTAAKQIGNNHSKDPRYTIIASELQKIKSGRKIALRGKLGHPFYLEKKKALPSFSKSVDGMLRHLYVKDGYGRIQLLQQMADRIETGEKPTVQQRDQMLLFASQLRSANARGESDRLLDLLGVARHKELEHAPRYKRLEVEATPTEIKPDGKSEIEIKINAFTYISGKPDSYEPIEEASVNVALIGKLGELSSEQVVTDSHGRAIIKYTVPTEEDVLSREVTDVGIRVGTEDGLVDYTYIHFISDTAKVQVEPHYGSGVSNQGVIPADTRFPATIKYILKDRDGNAIAGKDIEFSINNKTEAELETDRENQKKKLNVETDKNGIAQCRVRYTGPTNKKSATMIVVSIKVRVGRLFRSEYAYIEAGIDPAIKSVTPRFSKGLSAGEWVPVIVRVIDRFHGKHSNVGKLLNHWKDDPKTGQTQLWLKLKLGTAGNVPKYFSDLVGMSTMQTFEDSAWPMPYTPLGGNALMIEEVGHMNLPKVKLASSGQNLFECSVELGIWDTSGQFRKFMALPDPWPTNNQGFVVIPAGIKADATYIWLVQNPFAANSESAKLLRTIAGLHSLGDSVLNIADAITALNRGDVGELAAMVASKLKGKCLGTISDQYNKEIDTFGKAFATSAASAWSQAGSSAALIRDLTPMEGQTLDEVLEQKLVDGILKGAELKGYQLVVLRGDGEQQLHLKGQQKPIKTRADRISIHEMNGQPIASLKVDAMSVYCLPKQTKFRSVDSNEMKTF